MGHQYYKMETKTIVVKDSSLETSTWYSGASKRPCLVFAIRSGAAYFQVKLEPSEARALAQHLCDSAGRRELMKCTAAMEAE